MFGRLKQCVLSFIAVLALGGVAQAEQWQVVQSSGDIWLGTTSAQPASLGSISDVPHGATLITGKRGRVLLARGEETMVVGPNSVVTVPRQNRGRTTVIQRVGEIVFDVDKHNVKHFSVETPYLAAIVKGTNFSVSVGSTNAAVRVIEGRVEVKNLYSGETVDVTPGQTAAVRSSQAGLTVTGTNAGSVDIKAGVPSIPAARPMDSGELASLQAGSSPSQGNEPGDPAVDDDGGLIAVAGVAGGGGSAPGGGGATGDGKASKSSVLKGFESLAGSRNADVAVEDEELASAAGVASSDFQRPAGRGSGWENKKVLSNFAIAVGIATAAFLAFGAAYFRARFG